MQAALARRRRLPLHLRGLDEAISATALARIGIAVTGFSP